MLLSEKNIIKVGETVRGANMYGIVDPNGLLISKLYTYGLDYGDATLYIDWINDRNDKPFGMKQCIEILNKRNFIW